MKGFLAGILSGAVVSGLGLAAAERFLPVVDLKLPAPDAGEVAVPAGSEFNSERPDAPPILPGTEAPPESSEVPMVAAPGPESDSLPDTTPLDAPDAAPLQEAGLTPPAEAPSPVIVSGDSNEELAQPDIIQPDAPQIDVAAAPVEVVDIPETGEAPAAPAAGEPSPAPEVPVTVDAPEAIKPPTVPQAPDTAEVPVTAEAPVAPEMAGAPEPSEAPMTFAVPENAKAPETEAAPVTAAVPEAPTGPIAAMDAPPVAMAEVTQGLRLPVPTIEDMAPGVTTDRLPRIGAETAEPVEILAPALARNAVAFENTSNSPLISLILVDVGAIRPDPSVLADFPVPLTMALDPTMPDAAALMQAYRQAGLEVVILTPLPEGAAPADVEVAFQSFFATLPLAVAVMDTPKAVLQESRPRAAQVVEILAETGHGLVTYDKGLNTVMQIAGQASVPAATVFRDIDPGTHDVAAMKRFLDQAAFRAGQEGNVILKAEARPETLTALAEWTLGTRAASVAFAPLSAVLKP